MIRSNTASISIHTVRDSGAFLIWPRRPTFVGTGNTPFPDPLAPHDILAVQSVTIVFDPFSNWLACSGFDLSFKKSESEIGGRRRQAGYRRKGIRTPPSPIIISVAIPSQ
jgi:hypothetical protein